MHIYGQPDGSKFAILDHDIDLQTQPSAAADLCLLPLFLGFAAGHVGVARDTCNDMWSPQTAWRRGVFGFQAHREAEERKAQERSDGSVVCFGLFSRHDTTHTGGALRGRKPIIHLLLSTPNFGEGAWTCFSAGQGRFPN